MIEVINLKKVYHNKGKSTVALKGISFKIDSESIIGILGPNGAGKSTTIKILSTIIRPTEGKVFINNIDVNQNPFEARKQFVSILQNNSLELWLSVEENLKVFGLFNGLKGKDLLKQIEKVINMFDLTNYIKTRAGDLSGGYRRRLQVAKAFLVKTPLLYLDEPTESMDPLIKEKYLDFIKKEANEGRTIILTTQRIAEAEELCKRIMIINNGEIIADGKVNDIKSLLGKIVQVKIYFNIINADYLNALSSTNLIKKEINVQEKYADLAFNCDFHEILATIEMIAKSNHITKFEVKDPSLEEVFIKLLKGKECTI